MKQSMVMKMAKKPTITSIVEKTKAIKQTIPIIIINTIFVVMEIE